MSCNTLSSSSTKKMYQVWRINDFEASSNAYTTGRTESWVLKKDNVFNKLEDAKEYIRQKSLIFTTLSNFTVDIKSEEEKQKFIDEFCFGDKYLFHQRFFIGKPNLDKIRNAIENQGIIFVKESASNKTTKKSN